MTWALYVVALVASALLISDARPAWLWTTVAALALVGAMARLAREAIRG